MKDVVRKLPQTSRHSLLPKIKRSASPSLEKINAAAKYMNIKISPDAKERRNKLIAKS